MTKQPLERRLITNVQKINIGDVEVWCRIIVIDDKSRKIQGYQKPSVLLHPSFTMFYPENHTVELKAEEQRSGKLRVGRKSYDLASFSRLQEERLQFDNEDELRRYLTDNY